MLICQSCRHGVLFHLALPVNDPCYFCPRGGCKVTKCDCKKYTGIGLSSLSHKAHISENMLWGTWGRVQFMPPPNAIDEVRPTMDPGLSPVISPRKLKSRA